LTSLAITALVDDEATPFLVGGARWERGLLMDVGSTFTKVTVVEPGGHVVGSSTSNTTIDDDVTTGLLAAVDALPAPHSYKWALTCSSAAGGLRMVSVGLTAALSGSAGTLASLGAGGKVVGSESGLLDDAALERISGADPHLVLLAGGIDGGNADGLLHNAAQLGRLGGRFGVIVAGNCDAAERAGGILAARSDAVRVVPNVFPRPGAIHVAPARDAVRDLFMGHITKAKGLDSMLAALRAECEPTPLAVSRAVSARSEPGTTSVLVDVGGATTDVHSVGAGKGAERGVDLPVPDVLRTVEGDLGMRWGAPGIAAEVRGDQELVAAADLRRSDPSFVPTSSDDEAIDRTLATAAVHIALERHAGRVVLRHTPWGDRYHVNGKDLRDCEVLVATGGVFVHQPDPEGIITSALAERGAGFLPRNPAVLIDRNYSMYAIGLVARQSLDLASRMVAVTTTGESS
jgi:uncharacterized protein (TIGR01319 family)